MPARELELERLLAQWRHEGERERVIARVVVGATMTELRALAAEHGRHLLLAAFARTFTLWFR
jgi:hypothetical protein